MRPVNSSTILGDKVFFFLSKLQTVKPRQSDVFLRSVAEAA